MKMNHTNSLHVSDASDTVHDLELVVGLSHTAEETLVPDARCKVATAKPEALVLLEYVQGSVIL